MKLPIETVIYQYKNRLFGIALNITHNKADADDAVQDTFIKYHRFNKEFDNEEHMRAWLIRTTINRSKDITSSFWKRRVDSWQEYMNSIEFEQKEDRNLFESVMKLPKKYGIVIHLFYYEGLSVSEISKVLNIKENTIKSQLSRGRSLLKEMLKEEWQDE